MFVSHNINTTCTISVNVSNGRFFDFETTTAYTFNVIATDHGGVPRASTIQVFVDIVDVDDNPPTFVVGGGADSNHTTIVPENEDDAFVIQLFSADLDIVAITPVQFSILTQGTPFVIDGIFQYLFRFIEIYRNCHTKQNNFFQYCSFCVGNLSMICTVSMYIFPLTTTFFWIFDVFFVT